MKILWKTFYFDAAHSLPNYKGKCNCLHGHRWKVEIGITGPVQTIGSDIGMIIDFSKLKERIGWIFNESLDHQFINQIIANPTAENIIEWIKEKIIFELIDTNLALVRLKIYETPDSCIEWKEDIRNED